MNYSKKTKVVCTIGPSSWDPEVMRKMIDAGMNCARVNGAFADEAEIDKVTNLVRGISNEVALMLDVKGPEVRMNKFEAPLNIKPGDLVEIGNNESSKIYPANYSDLYKSLNVGQRIVIGDGDVELVIEEKRDEIMICKVVFGEILKPGKAMNLPGADIVTNVLTEKDIRNLKHAVNLKWDFVSPSFIQTAEAAREVKKYLEGTHTKLIAKIEDQSGIDNIDEILNEVEGIMVARGGLGVELGLEKVPMIQKMLIEKCNALGKPVITATQMLESMTYNPRPTRAEVNDVATAIMQGTDAVMLSGESSAGEYPIEAVAELTKIAMEIETNSKPMILSTKAEGRSVTDAVSKAAAQMCIEMGDEIHKVIVVSRTGRTARLLGRHRINQPLFVITSADYYARRIMLSKGINRAMVLEESLWDRDKAIEKIMETAKKDGVVSEGENILLLCKTSLDGDQYFPNVFEVVRV